MAATIPPVVLIKEKIAWFAGLPRGVDSGRSGHHECEFWHQFRVMGSALTKPPERLRTEN
eukprot:1109669-Amphidinium_carterae.1